MDLIWIAKWYISNNSFCVISLICLVTSHSKAFSAVQVLKYKKYIINNYSGQTPPPMFDSRQWLFLQWKKYFMCKKNIYVLTIIFLHEIDKGGLISVNYSFWLYFQKNVPNNYRENILFTWILFRTVVLHILSRQKNFLRLSHF